MPLYGWLLLGIVIGCNAGLLIALVFGRSCSDRRARKAAERVSNAEAALAEWTVEEDELEWVWPR